MMAYVIVWFVVITPFLVIPASWSIFRKAGFHPGLSVLTLFPVINVFVLYHIAFSNWPSRPFETGPVQEN
jgi:hypothetical protein